MNVLDIALVAGAVAPLVAGLYLVTASALCRRRSPLQPGTSAPSLVVVVPAHNEEAGIAATIRSLQAADYPAGRRRIVVVADNCDDGTANVARAAGAEVFERHDGSRRGKGFALQFAIDRLLQAAGWDLLVVVDADTDVSRNFLRALAAALDAGASAAQALYLPRHTARPAAVNVITEVALVAFHLVRSTARERLALSCGLRGNGMAFTRQVLSTVPHEAFSRTEDLEFGILLGLAGERVAFCGDAVVRGDMPDRAAAVAQQRERWMGGRFDMTRRYLWRLVSAAFRRRDAMLADLAIDLLLPPLSVLVMAIAAGVTASAIAVLLGGSLTPFVLWLAAGAAVGVHVAHAVVLARRWRDLPRLALSLPGYAAGKCVVATRALIRNDQRWLRTQRQGELS